MVDTTRQIAERVRRQTRNPDVLALCDAVLSSRGGVESRHAPSLQSVGTDKVDDLGPQVHGWDAETNSGPLGMTQQAAGAARVAPGPRDELRECLEVVFERLEAAGATLHPITEAPIERMATILGIDLSGMPTEARDINNSSGRVLPQKPVDASVAHAQVLAAQRVVEEGRACLVCAARRMAKAAAQRKWRAKGSQHGKA